MRRARVVGSRRLRYIITNELVLIKHYMVQMMFNDGCPSLDPHARGCSTLRLCVYWLSCVNVYVFNVKKRLMRRNESFLVLLCSSFLFPPLYLPIFLPSIVSRENRDRNFDLRYSIELPLATVYDYHCSLSRITFEYLWKDEIRFR